MSTPIPVERCEEEVLRFLCERREETGHRHGVMVWGQKRCGKALRARCNLVLGHPGVHWLDVTDGEPWPGLEFVGGAI